jgi:hypothetical protein
VSTWGGLHTARPDLPLWLEGRGGFRRYVRATAGVLFGPWCRWRGWSSEPGGSTLVVALADHPQRAVPVDKCEIGGAAPSSSGWALRARTWGSRETLAQLEGTVVAQVSVCEVAHPRGVGAHAEAHGDGALSGDPGPRRRPSLPQHLPGGTTGADEHVDENARTRTTLLHYERQSLDGELERLERPWVLHWYEPDGFERLATEADCTSSTPDPSHQITRCSQ